MIIQRFIHKTEVKTKKSDVKCIEVKLVQYTFIINHGLYCEKFIRINFLVEAKL